MCKLSDINRLVNMLGEHHGKGKKRVNMNVCVSIRKHVYGGVLCVQSFWTCEMKGQNRDRGSF